jgi:hypothetical protein
LHNFPPGEWAEDLELAGKSLSVLRFCGTGDSLAAKFYCQLVSHQEELSAFKPEDTMPGPAPSISGHSRYILEFPPDAPHARVRLSLELLGMLCSPCGASEGRSITERQIKQGWRDDPQRFEHAQLMERLDWDAEARLPFQWDVAKILGHKTSTADVICLIGGQRRFMESDETMQPQGWQSGLNFIRDN